MRRGRTQPSSRARPAADADDAKTNARGSLLAPLLLIIGGIVVLVRRGRGTNPYEDLDEDV